MCHKTQACSVPGPAFPDQDRLVSSCMSVSASTDAHMHVPVVSEHVVFHAVPQRSDIQVCPVTQVIC